jgi:hypothetical protein
MSNEQLRGKRDFIRKRHLAEARGRRGAGEEGRGKRALPEPVEGSREEGVGKRDIGTKAIFVGNKMSLQTKIPTPYSPLPTPSP